MQREIVIALILALFGIAGSAALNEVSARFPQYRDWIFVGECAIWLLSAIVIIWLLVAPKGPRKVLAGLMISAGAVLLVSGIVVWNIPWDDFGVAEEMPEPPTQASSTAPNIADAIEVTGFRSQAHGPRTLLSLMRIRNRADATIFASINTNEFSVNGVNLTPTEHNQLPALRAGDDTEIMFPGAPANILRLPPAPNEVLISTEIRYGAARDHPSRRLVLRVRCAVIFGGAATRNNPCRIIEHRDEEIG